MPEKKYPTTCPACHGQRTQQVTCEQCRGLGCDSCANGYVTRNCQSCNGTGTK